MTTFALIAEGATDQIVIERIIDQVCGDMFEDGVFINPLQPLRDTTDAVTAPHGGWELVLEYCENRAADAFEANDYVVIHLDTDEGDHPNYGLPLTIGGADRSQADLVAGAIDIIKSKLGKRFLRDFGSRTIFAIAVHNVESWLLLCFFGRNEPKGSHVRLNRALVKKGLPPAKKDIRTYANMSKSIKGNSLAKMIKAQHSLTAFLVQLHALNPEIKAS